MEALATHRFCVAPMMDWTDRHCRAFHRQLSRHARLYTEMVTTAAVIHGDRERLLGFGEIERPLALQLGGSDPGDLVRAARIGEDWGYDEINLNVGCPSDRVQSGRFGACLMKEPKLVADCLAAMRAAAKVPVTVKCRIGVDDQDPEHSLFEFVDTVAQAGVSTFVVHARKAWLKGLSPKENREVPPLDHELVFRLKAARPELTIVLNGGISNLAQVSDALTRVDGVMVGRAAYQEPWFLADVDARLFGHTNMVESPHDVVQNYKPYIVAQIERGVPLHAMTRHMFGLFSGRPGARSWRRTLSEQGCPKGAGVEVIEAALRAMVSVDAQHSVAA